MPRTLLQNQRLRIATRQRLLAAAYAVFARTGFERATVREIAEEANVAQGLLYSYFRSKEELLREVFREGARDVAEAFGAAAPARTPREQLERVIRRSLEIVQERRAFWQLSYMLRHHPRTVDLLGAELSAFTTVVQDQLERMLAANGDAKPRAVARVLFAAIDGVAQQYVMDPHRYPLDAIVDALVDHFARRRGPRSSHQKGTKTARRKDRPSRRK